jgi:hypothetical protein
MKKTKILSGKTSHFLARGMGVSGKLGCACLLALGLVGTLQAQVNSGSSVAAFGRKPPSELPSQFAALCRDAAT